MNRKFGCDSREDRLLELRMQRCVDGELTETEERQFLSELDLQPEAWRRLALLFLESRILSAVLRTGGGPSPVAPTIADAGSRARMVFRPHHALRGAALLLVILLSYGAGRWSLPSTAPTAVPVQPQANAGPGSAATVAPSPTTTVEASPAESPSGSLLASGTNPDAPELYVRVNLPGSDQSVEVPVYRAPEEWQPFAERTVSAELQRALQRAGYDVSSTRQVLAVTNPDGPPILLPLESIDVQMARY